MKPFLIALMMVMMTPSLAAKAETALEVGQPAPGFTATDTTGAEHSLSDFLGKIVVLEWNNPGCPYVVKHYDSGNMQSLQKKYTGADVVWLTVNSGAEGKQGYMSAEEANAYITKQGAAPSAYFLDPDGAIGKLYDAKTTPHMFVIDTQGKIAYMGAIDSDNSFKPETIAGATNYVAAAIDSLKAGSPVEMASSQPYGCNVKYK